MAMIYFSNLTLSYIFNFEKALSVIDKLNTSGLSRDSLFQHNDCHHRCRCRGCFQSKIHFGCFFLDKKRKTSKEINSV